jgi:hypothetical protein
MLGEDLIKRPDGGDDDSSGEDPETGFWVPEIWVIDGLLIVFWATEADEVKAGPLSERFEVGARDKCHLMTAPFQLMADGDEWVNIAGASNSGEQDVKGRIGGQVSGLGPFGRRLQSA